MKSSNNNNKSNTSQTIPSHHTMRYMPGLDGMRALAVFAVVTYHLDLKWAQGGLLGVNLFFVLSGFLITNILLYQWEEKGRIDLKDFWIRRARRLLPALFLMLSSVFSWVIIFDSSRLAALKGEVLAAIFYVSNWHLILKEVSYFESFGPPSPLGHLWSLAIEEQFYILWPVLLGLTLRYLIKRKRVIGGTIIVILVSVAAMALIYVPGMDPSRVYYGTDTRAFALLIGALLAMVWPSWKMDVQLSSKKKACPGCNRKSWLSCGHFNDD
jgi:peptidoglycan/LPS O-acetylase OafA/YrhL